MTMKAFLSAPQEISLSCSSSPTYLENFLNKNGKKNMQYKSERFPY